MGEPRKFAPLGDTAGSGSSNLPNLKGIVFDVDGTLCEPQTYMFGEMRSALGIEKGVDILDHCHSLPPAEEEAALTKIRAIESRAMLSQVAQPGLVDLMTYLEAKTIQKGICTRNFDAPVTHLLDKFLDGKVFGPVVTREFKPPKPHPAGILHIAETWGLEDGREMIMVGDSIDDMTAGYRAGCATVLLVNPVNAHLAEHEHTDLVIARLDELVDVLEKGFVGRVKGSGESEEGRDTHARAEKVLKSGKGESV